MDLVQAQGWDPVFLSRLQAGLALAAGTLGALAIGIWSDRAGPLPALNALFVASGAAFILASLMIAAGGTGVAGPVVLGLTSVLPSLLIVALVPALMQASRNRPGAATQFEVYMATMNLGSVTGAAASGSSGRVIPLTLVGLLVALAFAASAALARRPDLVFHGARALRRPVARPQKHHDAEIPDLDDGQRDIEQTGGRVPREPVQAREDEDRNSDERNQSDQHEERLVGRQQRHDGLGPTRNREDLV